MSIFDHKQNNKSSQVNNGPSKNHEEISKEFLPTNHQASRMSNAFVAGKSQPKNHEEIAKEFLPTNHQASRMSNAFAAGKSQSKSHEEIAKEFTPSKGGQTFKHDNGANLSNQKPQY